LPIFEKRYKEAFIRPILPKVRCIYEGLYRVYASWWQFCDNRTKRTKNLMMNKNHYETLEIQRNAGFTEIKKAYRILAIKYHPDRHYGNKIFENKFIEVNEAYSVLIDKNEKVKYDEEWDKFFNVFDEKSNLNNPKKEFDYIKQNPIFNPIDRTIQNSEEIKPIFDHFKNKLNENLDFFCFPKKIGKIISGYSNIQIDAKPASNTTVFKFVFIGALVGLLIGSLIVYFFSITNPIWYIIWLICPTLLLGILPLTGQRFSGYCNYIGINGFAEFKCEGNRNNIIYEKEVNFNKVTDLITISQINKMNFNYSSTSYGFAWLNFEEIVLEENGEHNSKEHNPDKNTYYKYWLNHIAERFWTIYKLDNMESDLQEKGFLNFNIAFFENGKYNLSPYINLGIGYIEFINKKGNIKYNFDEIKRIYSNGSTLYIEHINYQQILFFIKSGNRNEIPLLNLTNRQFFFKSLEILLGYKLN
jgi:hypothetical protein